MLVHTRGARLRAALIALLAPVVVACEGVDQFTSVSDAPAAPLAFENFARPSFSSGFRGGIPFGVFHLPQQAYGSTFNGALANLSPNSVVSHLEAARRSGTRLILSLSGNESNYRDDDDDDFSFSRWKQRVDRYRHINFAPYVADGTLLAHYLMDEPHDKSNWGGRTVSPETVDQMAAYSKQLWPTLPTIVRSWPAYLKGRKYQHLDAAWAQYSAEYGASSQRLPIAEFMAKNVGEARQSGLALVVGINLLAGGTRRGGLRGFYSDRYAPGAEELEQWGKVMLADPYPCAFISWKFESKYLDREDISAAMATLSREAQKHASKDCGTARAQPEPGNTPPDSDGDSEPPAPDDSQGSTDPEGPTDPPVPTDLPAPSDPPAPTDPQGPPGNSDDDDDDDDGTNPGTLPSAGGNGQSGGAKPVAMRLNVTAFVKSNRKHAKLVWSGLPGREVDVYRDGKLIKVTENDGKYTNARGAKVKGAATYVYRVCARRSSNCSNTATAAFSR